MKDDLRQFIINGNWENW